MPDDRRAEIYRLRHPETGKPPSVRAVGQALGMSHQRVSEIDRQEMRRHAIRAVDPESIHSLRLSIRTSNCLAKAKIATIAELCAATTKELVCIRAFGWSSLLEIRKALAARGLALAGDAESDDKELRRFILRGCQEPRDEAA